MFCNHRKDQILAFFFVFDIKRPLSAKHNAESFACKATKINRHKFPIHEAIEHSSAPYSRDLLLHHKMCLQFFLLLRFQRFFFRSALEMITMVGRKEKLGKINSIEVSIVAQFHDEFLAFVCGLSIKRCGHKRKREMREISSHTL